MSTRLSNLDLECLARALWETYGEVSDGQGWDQLSSPQRSLWRSTAKVALSDVVSEIVTRNVAAAEEEATRLAEHVAELEPALDRVRRLHSQDDSLLEPGKWCPGCGHEEPCPTIRALKGGE